MELNKLKPALELMDKLPPPKIPCEKPATTFNCVGCGKPQPLETLRYVWTGVLHASDGLCPECVQLVSSHALVICLGCKAVVGRMPPHRLKSGFRVEAKKCYHTDRCPNCWPGVERSFIIEAKQFKG